MAQVWHAERALQECKGCPWQKPHPFRKRWASKTFPGILSRMFRWPQDVYSYVDLAPLLASAGYRVIFPFLRGFGTTRFLSSETFRNGLQSAVALDTVALMDALKIRNANLAGYGWGARTADFIAALWPERCRAPVSVSGYPSAKMQRVTTAERGGKCPFSSNASSLFSKSTATPLWPVMEWLSKWTPIPRIGVNCLAVKHWFSGSLSAWNQSVTGSKGKQNVSRPDKPWFRSQWKDAR
jgi:pimeloyl-ACP methyl ester carboxylesterase